MRSIGDVESNKAKLNAVKTTAAVISLPPGYIVGYRLRTENLQMIVGKGVMNCRSTRVSLTEERIIAGEEYISPQNIIRGLTYYVYMNSSREIKVDSIEAVWDDDNFGYYHPSLWQFRFLGQFDIDTDGTYKNIINQDPVIGTDIDARNVESLLIKTLLAQVSDYIVVGQDPEGTPSEDDWACFIYEDRMEIKQYSGGTWLIKQKFGSSTIISVEIYLGFESFSGTTTLDSPGEGDTVHYISGATDQYQEYTNGGWVVTATGIKIGGLVAGLFLNMVGCGGVYHPNNPPTTVEQLPGPNFRVFNFEDDYEDQHGVDDWSTKSNLAFDTTVKKYGSVSLWATSGNLGALVSPAGGTVGESQSMGAWVYINPSGTATGGGDIYIMQCFNAGNYIMVALHQEDGSDELTFNITIIKNSVIIIDKQATGSAVLAAWNYIGFAYNSTTDKAYAIVNNSITDLGVLGGTWGAGTFSYIQLQTARAYAVSGITHNIYYDELLFYWDQFLDPNILAQHYTHDVAWDTSGRTKADLLLQPDSGGRVMLTRIAGDITQVLTWHLIEDPGTDWFASKTSGWTGDSFSGGLEIDFSTVVPIGTKAVEVVFYQSTSGGITYWRKSGDANISNTPHASKEYSHIVARSESTAYYAKAILWLSDDYKVQIAAQDTAQDVYFSYPVAVLR
jgi:hypothetical protein